MREKYPELKISEKDIIRAASTINITKAGSWDNFPVLLFKFLGKCCQTERCKTCVTKIEILKTMVTKQYWEDGRSRKHL